MLKTGAFSVFVTYRDMDPEVCVLSREEWRSWLEQNHDSVQAIWLALYKKHTGKSTLTYRDSLEEALCFGWIDGVRRSIDSEKYACRFTPRNKRSKWSSFNLKLAEKLIHEGFMAPAGREAYERREIHNAATLAAGNSSEIQLAPELEAVLKENKAAWQNYQGLAPSYRKQYAGWIMTAKRPETRDKRLQEAIGLLEQNKKLGMK